MSLPRAALLACLLAPFLLVPARADDWAERKCALYAQAVQDALAARGPAGLRESFLAANTRFIASGCTANMRICAATPQEYALADMLTMMTMNEGMASTFAPFGCSD